MCPRICISPRIFLYLYNSNKNNYMKDITNYVHKNSWFELDGDLEDYDEDEALMFTTRDNGDVGDESYGDKDWDEAERVMIALLKEFGDKILQIDVTTCDESVNIEIELKS